MFEILSQRILVHGLLVRSLAVHHVGQTGSKSVGLDITWNSRVPNMVVFTERRAARFESIVFYITFEQNIKNDGVNI